MKRSTKPLGALFWVALVAVATGGLWTFRNELDKAHMALTYLLIVLGGSARLGRGIGLTLAVVCFFCFNFFLLSPHYTLVVADPLDWLVLLAFMITSAVAAQLLYRAQREAVAARQRAEEIDRLSTLGAETLNAGRAEEAVVAIARVMRSTLGIDECEIYLREEGGHLHRIAPTPRTGDGAVELLVREVAEQGRAAVERIDGTSYVIASAGNRLGGDVLARDDVQSALLPLRVRERCVGVLRLRDGNGLSFDAAQRRFAGALAYYAALGVERVRLVAEAEHAEALREADRLKDALIASVSHDLRTPLTTIKALAHDIRVQGDERAATIEEEADRLNRFVSDLLDLSRLDGGAVRVAPELIAAEDLLGAAIQRTSGTPGACELRAHLPPGEPILVGRFDFAHSLRALVNLIENALKYSPPGAPVEVTIGREGDWLEVSVSDRGPGVPPGERERIFQPFYRSGDTPDVRGTGLGLTIARRLAEAQGGALRYEPREGGGSVFTLLLPAAELPGAENPL